jgi:hypothetical protein
MFTISVDLSALEGIRAELEPDFGMLQLGIVEATRFVRDTWVSAVTGNKLPGMVRAVNDDKYARALTTGEAMQFPQLFHGIVMPVGADDIVERIENGFPSFDMKPGLLNGPKSRPSKDGGRFNTVPFRHYTPKANSSISVKMRMPNEVYNAARKLAPSRPGENGRIQWGESLQWNSPPATSQTGYPHQTSIYQGMYRVGAEKHTQYLTFRRVSTKSAPNSWIHPGVSANPVIQAVYNYCMPQVEEYLYKVAEKAFGIT